MGITINARQNVSYLFSSFQQAPGISGNNNWLSDYASIKNGSYGKLMKAYYKEENNDVKALAKKSLKQNVSNEETKVLSKVKSTSDALKNSADQLLTSGSKSVFAQKNIASTDENGIETNQMGYDVDAIYKAVSNFVKDYNAVISAVGDSGTTTVLNRAGSMINQSVVNSKLMSKVGITIKSDHTLALDKATFEKSDMKNVQSLFQGNGSYGYQISAQSSMMNYTADRMISQAGTYTASASYSNLNVGNLFNGYF